jgi:hypothetical protein
VAFDGRWVLAYQTQGIVQQSLLYGFLLPLKGSLSPAVDSFSSVDLDE